MHRPTFVGVLAVDIALFAVATWTAHHGMQLLPLGIFIAAVNLPAMPLAAVLSIFLEDIEGATPAIEAFRVGAIVFAESIASALGWAFLVGWLRARRLQ